MDDTEFLYRNAYWDVYKYDMETNTADIFLDRSILILPSYFLKLFTLYHTFKIKIMLICNTRSYYKQHGPEISLSKLIPSYDIYRKVAGCLLY
ncbi:hypothetical protein NQ317_009684 [Molorchus minor]|uniref:Uncharacterized protein n=1 Tax=Molorchus minor TaxID=1323400 RepID=A0ABQ9JGU3_9CUCU|nr:hypothetical protein NQ317_009684 [Molorchus minor]